MMNVTIQPVRGTRGIRFTVTVEGAPLRTKFLKTRSFGTETAARKAIAHMVGNDAVVRVGAL